MTGREHDDRRPGRWEPQRAWAVAIFALGLLLVSWPFVRTPPLSLGGTTAHLLGAWLVIVVALGAMARALRRGPGGPDA